MLRRSQISKIPSYPIPSDLKVLLSNYAKSSFSLLCPDITDTNRYISTLDKLKNSDHVEIMEKEYISTFQLGLYINEWESTEDLMSYCTEVKIEKFTPNVTSKLSKHPHRDNLFKIKIPKKMSDEVQAGVADTVQVTVKELSKVYDLKIERLRWNEITISGKKDFCDIYDRNLTYTLNFNFNSYPYQCAHNAVVSINFNVMRPRIYPSLESFASNTADEPISYSHFEWFNNSIADNHEQKQAIANIINRSSYPAPFILYGPAGTGKTATIVEAICQAWEQDPNSRILVCTPSNTAADVIASRLAKYDLRRDLLRFYSQYRGKSMIPQNLLEYSNFQTGLLSSDFSIASERRIVVCTLCQSTRLIMSNIRSFNYLFVDEAGQAIEPDTVIPFHLFCPDNFLDKNLLGHVILSGDPMQLGPVVQSNTAESILGTSMLERLMKRDLYKKDSNNKYNEKCIIKLLKNYRNHESIIKISNNLFYDNELTYFAGAESLAAENWSELPNRKIPVIFHGVRGVEQKDENSPSSYNESEIREVLRYVETLLYNPLPSGKMIMPENIGIVTPFVAQTQKISKYLQEQELGDIEVGTVEMFQGQERDVIIVSTVRSRMYFHDERKHLGSLSDPKRLNVCLTRSKFLLIVIGNQEVLQTDDNWRYFIKYCIDNQACTGIWEPLQEIETHSNLSKPQEKIITSYDLWDRSINVNSKAEENYFRDSWRPVVSENHLEEIALLNEFWPSLPSLSANTFEDQFVEDLQKAIGLSKCDYSNQEREDEELKKAIEESLKL